MNGGQIRRGCVRREEAILDESQTVSKRIRKKMADGEELFAVDKWGCSKSKVFFLTHMHADHTKGLTQQWHRGPIYCSAITASLLALKFPHLDIRILPLSTPTLIRLPSPNLLEVTAIDADHCPGSVMFIFRGAFGCILHTGDFRWESGSPKLEIMKQCIDSAIGGCGVNLVHLDNTFCNPGFSFPTRHAAAQQVVDIIINHEAFDVLIGVDMLGKEELLIFVSKALNTKIWVWPERMQTMKFLGITEYFTTDTSATKVRAVPRYSISNETLSMLNEMRPTVAILPSGLNFLCKAFDFASTHSSTFCATAEARVGLHALSTFRAGSNEPRMQEKHCDVKRIGGADIFCVPYSLHSCLSELKEFLRFVKPQCVKGNLSSSFLSTGHLLEKQSFYEYKASCSAIKSNVGTIEQYLHIVNRDATPEKSTHICKSVKASIGLRKESYNRSRRSWRLLRARRARGTCLRTEP